MAFLVGVRGTVEIDKGDNLAKQYYIEGIGSG
jgi:hypothetical protein